MSFSKSRRGIPYKLNKVEVSPKEIKVFQLKTDIKFIYIKNKKKKKQFQFISSKYGEQIYKYRKKTEN